MNKAAFKLVLDRILFDPSCWDQDNFHDGTKHCIGGWAQLMSGRTPNDHTVFTDAREFLDISQQEAVWLFDQERTIADFKRLLKSGFWDKKGFGLDGYNAQGYDGDGFDGSGYNAQGYDRDGYDKLGYDRDGFKRDGYNYRGYDKEGFDHYGRDFNGYDRSGYNCSGYDRSGYNKDGFDRHGLTRENKRQ